MVSEALAITCDASTTEHSLQARWHVWWQNLESRNLLATGVKEGYSFNNVHRIMLYLAIIILFMKYIDVFHTLRFHSTDGNDAYGFSVGTLVLATESFLLTMYVTSCHAFRHLVGGGNKRWSLGLERIQGLSLIHI